MNRQTPSTAQDVLKTTRQTMRAYKDARTYKHDRTLPYFQYTTDRKDATNLIAFAIMTTGFQTNKTITELAHLLKDTFTECGTQNAPTLKEIKTLLTHEKKTRHDNSLREMEIRIGCMGKLFPQTHAIQPFRFYAESRNFINKLIRATMDSMRTTNTKTKNIMTTDNKTDKNKMPFY